MKNRTAIVGLVLLALVGIATAYLFLGKQPNDPERIVVGVSPFQDTILPIVGEELGFYEEEGLIVEFRVLGWTEVLEALSAPEGTGVDVAIYNICGVVGGHQNNPNLVYAYGTNPFDKGAALLVRPDENFLTIDQYLAQGLDRENAVSSAVRQLRGRKIITTSNTDMEQNVWSAITRAGLDFERDVEIVNLPPEEGLAAFLSGEGDAYLGGVPQRFAAVREGMLELVSGTDLGPAPINGFVTTQSFADGNSEKLVKMLRVWFRIVQHTNENIDETANIVSARLNAEVPGSFSPDDFKNAWNVIESFPPSPDAVQSDILDPSGPNYWRSRWNACNDYFVNVSRSMESPVQPEGVFRMQEFQEMLVPAQ